jgi:DNA-binding response OmpR family regulator
MVPVIMVTGVATASTILAARDAGVHEFLRKPFNMKDLTRRLEAVTLKDRDWVEAMGYVGPDRRRFNSGDYRGPKKRQNDDPPNPQEARIVQALKILRSAIAGIEADPEQAMRSMLAQATTIQQAATELKDLKLTMAAATFYRHLAASSHDASNLDRGQLERAASPLLALLPKGEDERRAA